jgi:predicted aspartyl protease
MWASMLIQGIAVAAVLHVAIFVFILYYSGHLSGAKRFLFAEPQEVKKTEPGKQRWTASGGVRSSVLSRGTSPIRSENEGTQNVYCWTDQNGIKNFSNLPPPSHVTNFETREMPIDDRRSDETKVIIKANQVIVPVRLGYRGQEFGTYLLLDTGASTTMINRRIAEQLNIRSLRPGIARVADGRSIQVYWVNLDYIAVGPHKISDFRASIVDHQGKLEPFEGLLGMNFLREVNYHVDFQRSVISWARFE